MPYKVFETTRELFFPTPIFFKDLKNGKEINEKLIPLLYDWKKRDEKGIVRSNKNGWHSGVDMHQRQEYRFFVKELFKFVDEVFRLEEYHPKSYPVCDNMWANINNKYSYNRSHTHPGCLMSGVYYVKTPKNCGRLYFSDPKSMALQIPPVIENTKERQKNGLLSHQWREVNYDPLEGRVILFPSYLSHEVEQNLNEDGEDRISLSFNFIQKFDSNYNPEQRPGHRSDNLSMLDL